MVIVYVTYAGDAGTHFNRTYYRAQHLPLVRRCWQQYGRQSVAAFYPEEDGAGTIAVCMLKFRDEAAVTAAVASQEAPQVMADVKDFTDVKPSLSREVPLSA